MLTWSIGHFFQPGCGTHRNGGLVDDDLGLAHVLGDGFHTGAALDGALVHVERPVDFDLQAMDAAHYLHPFTDHKELGERGTRIIERAEGVYRNDLRDGVWKLFRENGELKQENHYQQGDLLRWEVWQTKDKSKKFGAWD